MELKGISRCGLFATEYQNYRYNRGSFDNRKGEVEEIKGKEVIAKVSVVKHVSGGLMAMDDICNDKGNYQGCY